MGATQSWCFGENTQDAGSFLPGKRRGGRNDSGSSTSSRSSNGMNNGPMHQRSIPKAIQVHAPAYSGGSFETKYEMISEIGHGSTSIVYRCCEKRNGTTHACKIINRRAVLGKRNELMEQFQVEIQVLQSMKHPNIIRIDDVYLTDSKICMVTEYMDGGELFDYIVDKGTLSEVEASSIVRKITSAIAYMHACGVIHRDLKPENLMLTSKHAGAEVKIIDFGLAKLLDNEATTQSFLGTRGYLAPEMLQRQAYSRTVDIWALGVIVYVLLCGCLPFNDDGGRIANEKAARAKFGLRYPRWASGLSDSAKDLLQHLLEVDATKRYTAEQALAHPWVTGQQTPDHYLRSPNYLRNIRAKRTAQANGNRPAEGEDTDEASRIRSRRQSR
ncbi:hypothetical protein Poli38472_004049 [Pythium oligandrum]|uniref:Protein kinase domain-containing protein n=1 Tax=Pythium oligandrum TaxID=41045 RepID=A0A8K1FMH4_PYTOL|nr:hypothetical protein Poli38472_004049 [Pythium oligandrum]|eukprot:TMW66284.1 hypothetical protein Poli38472_004049 [Pythium oligandrum]